MAGTTPRTGDPESDARRAATLLASAKDRAEHQITIDPAITKHFPLSILAQLMLQQCHNQRIGER